MRESAAVRFLYRTVPGRMLLKVLVQPKVSKAAGLFLSSGASKWIVPCYIRKHKIDMCNIEIPPGGFSSFNDFFTRKRKTKRFDTSDGHLISPCDGFLSAVRITENTVLNIKNTRFTLDDLLKDHELAGRYGGGTAFVFRLTPADYHRYCYVTDGRIISHRKIRGVLHCVRPIALETVPVFTQNSREYQILETECFGTVIQMEIGALLVGKIRNDTSTVTSGYVQKGTEKGYFEFGGSTIVILVQKNRIRFQQNLYKRRNRSGEIPVHMGEYIARAEKEG